MPIAHRGLHDAAHPENTLGAFEAAATGGYAMELDVRMSVDDHLVVIHDETTRRLTSANHVVSDTEAGVLTALSVESSRYTIPLLDEVFTVVDGRTPILIDVKPETPMARVGPPLVAAIAAYRGEVAVQSIDPRVLWWLRRHAPHVIRGQLSWAFVGAPLPAVRRFLLRTMAANLATTPDFIAYDINALPDMYVRTWQRALRAPLLGWTIRTESDLQRSVALGANPIFDTVRPLQAPLR